MVEALLVYKDLPLGDRERFFTNHTKDGEEIRCSHYLDQACTTLGHPKAAPTTNFIRKLYHTMISGGAGQVDGYEADLRGLADINYHSYKMATSSHYDLSEFLDGPLIKKNLLKLPTS